MIELHEGYKVADLVEGYELHRVDCSECRDNVVYGFTIPVIVSGKTYFIPKDCQTIPTDLGPDTLDHINWIHYPTGKPAIMLDGLPRVIE